MFLGSPASCGQRSRNLSKHAQSSHSQTVGPNASGVTNATRGAPIKTKKCPRQPQLPMLRGSRGHNQPTAAPSIMQPGASAQKRQKQVDHSQSSAPQSKNSPQSSNEQKHQRKEAQQSAPSLAEEKKPSQPPPEAAHHEQNSRRSTPSAQQDNPSQPSNASHGKGKGGGEKKSDKRKTRATTERFFATHGGGRDSCSLCSASLIRVTHTREAIIRLIWGQ